MIFNKSRKQGPLFRHLEKETRNKSKQRQQRATNFTRKLHAEIVLANDAPGAEKQKAEAASPQHRRRSLLLRPVHRSSSLIIIILLLLQRGGGSG